MLKDLLVKKLERDREEAEKDMAESFYKRNTCAQPNERDEHNDDAYMFKGKKEMCEDLLKFIMNNS